ncbi:MAG TPA: NUDIX hydrolase [Spirochaetia bacterium]|nr:NUDIX hydrolase [Spirochaetia bacterium]
MVAGDGSGGLKWRRVSTRELLSTRIFKVVERDCEAPGGKVGRFVALEAPEWATVVPLVEGPEGPAFLMVRQYRHGSDEISVEFPGGVVEEGEEPAAAAARELEEETGYRARSMTDLGWTYPNPAFMGNRFHVFLAEGCEPEGRVCLDEHELVDAFLVPVGEVRERMGKGQYSHALMVVALYLAERELRSRSAAELELASRPSAGL